MKLYSDDPDVHYSTTKIKPERTKVEIDGILGRWGIVDIAWTFDLDNNRVRVQFQLNEKFKGKDIHPVISLEPPRIWNKANRNRGEQINWSVSMRVLFWYVKTTLEMAYSMQSEKTLAFLSFVKTGKTSTLKDDLMPELARYKALPEKQPEPEIIDV